MFKPSWVAPGPGVEKDAPPKKGPARYFEILLRDAGTLWKAGALFCLCCLPMAVCAAVLMLLGGHPAVFVAALAGYVLASVPAGPAMAGLHFVVLKTVRDEPGYVWHDFKTACRENRRQTRAPGMVLSFLLLIETLCARLVLYGAVQASALLYAGVILGLLLVFLVWHFFTMQVLFLTLPTRAALQNSVLLVFGRVWRSLPAGLLLAGAWAVMVLVLQPWFSLLLLCAGAPMLIVLWADFLLWPVMEKVFSITQHQREQRQAEADTDADGQSFP